VNAAPAVDTPTTTTLPLFGVSLTVEVSTGAGGLLTDVSVNPADGFTASQVKPNKVTFANADGTAKIVVQGRDGRQRLEAKAGSLADISGQGSWTGDVFGTGVNTDVMFMVGTTAEGGPDITNVTTTDPTADIGDTTYWSKEYRGDLFESAWARITFTLDGQQRTLKINVAVWTEDDDTDAKLSVSLGSFRGVFQPTADAVGPNTWVGLLCDGTEASIAYTVNEDGSISDVVATPETRFVKDAGRNVFVAFSRSEWVKIHSVGNDNGIKLSIDERIRCRDADDPTVNTPVDEDDSSDWRWNRGDHGDDRDKRDDRGDRDRNDRDRNDRGHSDRDRSNRGHRGHD
jgi:hypothetical protein